MENTKHFTLDESFDFNIIKNLTLDELNVLGNDVRELIIDRCSEFGGHLSSNLGIVNLTIALFRSFDLNKDKVIFDIGHYTYAYKILTGRPLRNLRLENGTDGFQRMSESKYDFYDAGHSSTSISACVGFAKARDFSRENYHCLAVVGDGGIANGLCFEALNNLIVDNTKIIIVLNDNEMSISPTVGGLTCILKGIKYNPFASYVFKDANFEYIGPIDGDNFKEMAKAFDRAKKTKRSVLVHVKTKKGLGYKYAMEDKIGEFHYVNPFDKENGHPKKNYKLGVASFSETFANLLDQEMSENKKAIAICPSTTIGAALTDVFSKYPLRTFDCGISEEHSAVFAASLGVNGYHPYLFMYSTFLQRAYDEIIHDITRLNVPCTILIDRAGLVGADGETHQGIYDDSFFFSIPNIALAMPHDLEDAKRLFNLASNYKHPFAIRFPACYKPKDDDISSTKPINFGDWEIVKKGQNKKYAILSVGPHINDINRVFKDDEDVTIINALFMKEYNKAQLEKLAAYNKIYIYDPYGVETGFCSNVLLELNKINYKGQVKTKAIPLQYITKGTKEEQEKRISVDVESFVKDFKNFISK
ncbi:MAG: 1-deoxy-D-xylulose-5-phosphate synthase [Bacilli bacterium]|nr:1-deoxy-D-xylulose-5-phosphate synthase [Bacilli bacterium]